MNPVHLASNAISKERISTASHEEQPAQQREILRTPPSADGRSELAHGKVRLWLYILLLGAAAVSHYLLGLRIFALTEEHIELWQRLTRSLGLLALVLLVSHLVSVFCRSAD